MNLTLLVARLLLAVAFVVAGVAKQSDRAGSRKAITDFGLPEAMAAPLGTLLPLAELGVGVALVPVATARWGALGALVLLLAFIVGISVNLVKGRKPDCHCFGQLHSAPIGWQTLARNAALALAAMLVLWKGAGSSAFAWLAHPGVTQTVSLIIGVFLLAGLAVLGWLTMHLLRQNGRLLLRVEALEQKLDVNGMAPAPAPVQPVFGLPVGTRAPALNLPLLSGGTRTLDDLLAIKKSLLLLFSDPRCGPCNDLLPDIARWQREHATTLTVALISRGTAEENHTKSDLHDVALVLLQKDREVAQSYHCAGTPGAVLIHSDGTIGSSLAQGADAIKALVAQITDARIPMPLKLVNGNGSHNGTHKMPGVPPATNIGETAPAVRLPDLTGKMTDLKDFRGKPTLLLFWNITCGFCTRMLDDLKAWEAHPRQETPQLLVISSGSVEQNQAMGLQSIVALDQTFSIGQAYGAGGTPSAVLIDAQGNIASEVAVGAPAVLALAGADTASNV